MWCGIPEHNSNIIPWKNKTSVTWQVPASRENSGHGKWGITGTAQWKGLINCNNTINKREWGRRANIMTFPEWASCLLMWSVFFNFISSSPTILSVHLSPLHLPSVLFFVGSSPFSLSLLAVVCTTYFPQSEKKVKTAEESQLRPRAVQSSTCQPIRESQKSNK